MVTNRILVLSLIEIEIIKRGFSIILYAKLIPMRIVVCLFQNIVGFNSVFRWFYNTIIQCYHGNKWFA